MWGLQQCSPRFGRGRGTLQAASAGASPFRRMQRAMRKSVLSLLLLPLLVGAVGAAFTCAGGNDAGTCGALGDLYAATEGPSWTDRTAWATAASGTATSYCSFTGVTCMGSAVVGLCVPAGAARLRPPLRPLARPVR